jgi:hypothetical protein
MIEVKAPFSLSEYQKGNYKVKYGNCNARIVCTDMKSSDGPIVAIIDVGGTDSLSTFSEVGRIISDGIEESGSLHLVKQGIEDGDIISVIKDGKTECITIASRDFGDGNFAYHAWLSLASGTVTYNNSCWITNEEDFVMSSEKDRQKMFDAMRKGGYRWIDSEKRVHNVAMTPFSPFDRVLCRDQDSDFWAIDLFRSTNIGNDGNIEYECMVNFWKQCVPYNEETGYLVNTTDQCPEEYKEW